MEIIFKKNENSINIEEVNINHTILCKMSDGWAVLMARHYNSGMYQFKSLNSITKNAGYHGEMVFKDALEYFSGQPMHAFECMEDAINFLYYEGITEPMV